MRAGILARDEVSHATTIPPRMPGDKGDAGRTAEVLPYTRRLRAGGRTTVRPMPTLEYDGARIHWEAAGPADAPALLLLHAGIATAAMWDPQWDDLQRDHRVVRYDLRWFGRTRSDDVPYSNRADAIAVLDAAGVDRATFVGASYGGSVAIDAVLEYPDRVSGLVTIGSGPGGFPPVDFTPREEQLIDALDEAEEARDWERLVDLEADFWGAGPTRDPDDLDPAFRATLRGPGPCQHPAARRRPRSAAARAARVHPAERHPRPGPVHRRRARHQCRTGAGRASGERGRRGPAARLRGCRARAEHRASRPVPRRAARLVGGAQPLTYRWRGYCSNRD